uniref:Ubiquitin-like domain-containing protein n=1 Tax=Aegilops tauschii subsp. strangulata TaxID=200361 RepID=A0A453C867_AEGTS
MKNVHTMVQSRNLSGTLLHLACCELKVVVSMVTGLEPREQRLLFRGKEREDSDHLHMVGVRDKDKVLLLEDPALKDIKLQAALAAQAVQ